MNFNQDKTQRQLIHAEYFEYKRNTVKSNSGGGDHNSMFLEVYSVTKLV